MDKNFGLNELGFRRKTYDEILEDLVSKSKEKFGETINTNVTSIYGMFLRVIAWVLNLKWQLIEKVYFSGFVNYANGVNLDRLASNLGIYRIGKQYSRGEVIFYGNEGTIIPEGTLVGTEDDLVFRTIEKGIIENGECTIKIISVEKGAGNNTVKGTIRKIINPILGVDSINNLDDITGARNEETDDEFRQRYFKTLSGTGASTINSIVATLLDVEGVRGAYVNENDTHEFVDGLPPHSISAYVVGGEKEDIGSAILNTKAAGINTVGNESVTVQDISGMDRKINFNYAEEILIDVEVDVITDNDYHRNGDVMVKDTIIKYIGGVDSIGNDYLGLNIGEDIIISQLIRELWKIKGLVDVNIKIGRVGEELKNENIKISEMEFTKVNKVVVNHV